jgi:eukaryotic-like serine/threonine-protein kinase
MDRDIWRRLQQHFDRLVTLDPAARDAAKAELGLSDVDLRRLTGLLEAHDRYDPQQASAAELLNLNLGEEDDKGEDVDWTGRSLGPWQVGEQIARGGMSVIHKGVRADGQFDKTVAIKVLDSERMAAFERHRLAEEVRILARLEHPGIARLIDSGTTDEDHTWLVMEFVDGQPLDAYARAHEPGPRDCVQLVIQAARALEYAHQRQVIHCDVKPSNILVTAEGRLRVVDFGIAALIQRQPESMQIGRLYCSPAYAAPERLTGAPPTTRQDVFSLGAVLYQLLTGRSIRPRDELSGMGGSEELTPPSVAVCDSDEHGRPLAIAASDLRGDLDAICLKALSPDPDRRYGGMSEFVSDLECWLHHRPVAARRGGRSYVIGRWLRRHALVASLGGLLLTAILVGALVALDQARKATAEANRALAARDFLVGMLEAADPTLEYGHDPTASELLRRGAERITHELADQDGLRIDLLHTIGRTQLERGLIEDAVASLDRALSDIGPRGRHPVQALIRATRGMAAYEQGDYGAAVRHLEQASAIAIEQDLPLAIRHGIEIQLADMLVVDQQAERALALTEPLLNGRLERNQRPELLRVHGASLEQNDRLNEAEGILREAWMLQSELDPAHINLAKIENDLGIVYWRLRDLDQAAEQFENAWRHKELIYGHDHPQTLASLGNLAGVQSARGDHGSAVAAYQRSLAGLERVHNERAHPDIAYTYGMIALSHYLNDDLTAALESVRVGQDIRDQLDDPDMASVRWLTRLRALLAFELGEPVNPASLGVSASRCHSLDINTPLDQRICLAWWSLVSTPPASCPSPGPQDVDDALQAQWPQRWRQVWMTIQQNCG